MTNLLYILWNPSLTIGPFRWYSLCWLIGLLLAYLVVRRLYKEQNIKSELFEPLFFYCFIGILAGARLGHCVFYQPDYFLTSGKGWIEMFLPIHFMSDGGWKFTGYEGLASHGGTLGLIIALWLYVRHTRLNIWQVLDNIAIATGSTACLIRLGNLMNSEIIGKVTDVPWAFIFERVDQLPRHPGQLYEAMAYAVLFALMWWMHKRMPQRIGTGWFFGFCLTYIFTFRFFIEYTKEVQEAFEASLPLDMGQLLSIPFVIVGIACMAGGKWMRRLTLTAALAVMQTPGYAGSAPNIYDLFAGDDSAAYYAASQEAKDRLLRQGNRRDYYVYCINEVNYEIRHNHSGRALLMSEKVLKEMREHEDGRYDMVYNAMASIYECRGNYRMARHYIDQALQYVEPGDTIGMVGACLGKAYLEAPVRPEEAEAYADKVMRLCGRYPIQYGYALRTKALASFFKGDQYGFFEIYDEYKIHQREHAIREPGTDHLMLALRHAFEGSYQQAADSINSDSHYAGNISRFDLLLQIYQMKGDQEKVVSLLRQKLDAVDSLSADLVFEDMNAMSNEMDLARAKEKVSRQRVYWLIAVIVLLVAVLALLLWRYLTRRRLQRQLLRQNKKLAVALDRAEESDRMKSLFIDHVSHEIRTPLNVITGFTQVITNPAFEVDEEDRNRMLSDISRNTEAITHIVDELLDIAQDESRMHYEKEDVVMVNGLCRKIMSGMESHNERKLKLDFVTDLTDDYTMVVHRGALEKILTQLLDNALKFTNEGRVELYVKRTSDRGTVCFLVSDTGVGISEEQQLHVFDRFFKVDNFKPGFGLGLTVAKKAATLLGGSLSIDKTYREGTRFVLALPAS